jgi:sulfur-carrier protein
MQIEIKLLTGLKQYLPDPDATGTVRPLEIAEPATVKHVLEKLGIPPDTPKVIMINDRQGALEDDVAPGDRVTFFPPVGGG